ncbi:phosphoglycolate phosphatase [Methanooceanicella nereidis]
MVVDIDGTITDMKRHVSLDAVKAIRALPIPVILATGNVICFVRAAAKLIGASDTMIGENGGVILVGYDSEPMVLADIGRCRQARDLLMKEFPGLTPLDEAYRKSELAFRRNIDVERAKSLVSEKFSDLEIVDTQFALHLKNKNVNKGTGLKKIASIMGLKPENFAAMGDSENDLPMLETAGVSISVGNAAPEIKGISTYVCREKYGEGAAEGFEWLKRQL